MGFISSFIKERFRLDIFTERMISNWNGLTRKVME